MATEADKRAMKKYMSNPENRAKVYARNREYYFKKRQEKYDGYADKLVGMNNKEDIIEYLMSHFSIKGGRC